MQSDIYEKDTEGESSESISVLTHILQIINHQHYMEQLYFLGDCFEIVKTW